MTSFYNEFELERLGLKKIGKNVKISKKSSIYQANEIEIGDNVRIDDFTVLSGKIKILNNVHIACYSAIFASDYNVIFEDFSGLSSRVTVYSSSDDYSGLSLTNPTVPNKYKNIKGKVIRFGKHSIIGASCVILPGAEIAEGVALGSMSLLNKKTESWSIYAGIPAEFIKKREKKVLELEKQYYEENLI